MGESFHSLSELVLARDLYICETVKNFPLTNQEIEVPRHSGIALSDEIKPSSRIKKG
jgi:hypothetical protein